jgi:hypothetical protein
MSNELTRTGDVSILNFADPHSGIVEPSLAIAQSCIDAIVIAKVGVGITDGSVKTAIYEVFVCGEYGHRAICEEMRQIVPSNILIESFEQYEDRVQSTWLAARQSKYFQTIQLGGVSASKSEGTASYDKIFDEDITSAFDRAGITREKMISRLEMMMFSEDDKVSIQAIKMIADMRGEGHKGKIHADRKRKENGAKVKLAANAVKQMTGIKGSLHDAQNAAALEAYKTRMRNKGIELAEVVE